MTNTKANLEATPELVVRTDNIVVRWKLGADTFTVAHPRPLEHTSSHVPSSNFPIGHMNFEMLDDYIEAFTKLKEQSLNPKLKNFKLPSL